MADTATTMQKIRAQRGKITLGDLGNPGMVKTMDAAAKALTKGRYFVGTIYGQVTDFVQRKNLKTEEMMEGLRGTFVGVPSVTDMDELESGVLFIPDAFHNIIAGQFREAQKADASAALEFAMEVYSIDAKNPAGYSWEMLPAVPFKGVHPLDNIMKAALAMTTEKRKALAAPARK